MLTKPNTITDHPEQYGPFILHETNLSITFEDGSTYDYDKTTGCYHRWYPNPKRRLAARN